ncbi:MAG: hypothetical protein RBU45_22645 [Myxococcota bacterium]|jgi:hypothetical protein|nr:hypothetical protein [Myxococcota bacterium]
MGEVPLSDLVQLSGFPRLLSLFPRSLGSFDVVVSIEEAARAVLEGLRRPLSKGEAFAAYLEQGELAAAEKLLSLEGSSPEEQARLRRAREEQQRLWEDERRRACEERADLDGVESGASSRLAVKLQEAETLAGAGRIGPARQALQRFREQIGESLQRQWDEVARRSNQLRLGLGGAAPESSGSGRDLSLLLEAFDVFRSRRDLASAAQALTLAEQLQAGAQASLPDLRALLRRATSASRTHLLVRLPPAIVELPLLELCRQLRQALGDVAAGRPVASPAVRELLEASGLPLRDLEVRIPVLEFWAGVPGNRDRRTTHLLPPAFLREAGKLCGFVSVAQSPVPLFPELLYQLPSPLVLKDPRLPLGGSDEQGRELPAFLLIPGAGHLPLSAVQGQLGLSSLAANRVLLLFVAGVATGMANEVRRWPHQVALFDDHALLRCLFSPDSSTAFLREIYSSLNPTHVCPYNARGKTHSLMFRGREEELHRTLQGNRSYILYGGRMMGKSSLMARIAQQCREQGWKTVEKTCEGLRRTKTHTQRLDPVDLCRTLLEGLGASEHTLEDLADFKPFLERYLGANPTTKVAFFVDEVDDLLDSDSVDGYPVCRMFRSLTEEGYASRIRFFFAGFKKLYDSQNLLAKPLTRFAEEMLAGPLDEEAARTLIQGPLELLGFVIKDQDLVLGRICTYTSRHPALIQHFCSLLIQFVESRSTEPPFEIEAYDVSAVYRSSEFRDQVRWVLEQNFDPIQEFLIYLIAHHNLACEQQRFTAESLMSWVTDLLGPKDLILRQISTNRLRIWLRELEVMRVLDRPQGGWQFALGVYPQILADAGDDLATRALEILQEASNKGSLVLSSLRDATEPTCLHDIDVLLRDTEQSYLVIGEPGLGRSYGLDQLRRHYEGQCDVVLVELLTAATRDEAIRELAGALGVSNCTLRGLKDCLRQRSAVRNRLPLLLLLDDPVLLADAGLLPWLLDTLAALRDVAPGRSRFVISGGASAQRSFAGLAESFPWLSLSYLSGLVPEQISALLARRLDPDTAPLRPLLEPLATVTGGRPLLVEEFCAYVLEQQEAGRSLCLDRVQEFGELLLQPASTVGKKLRNRFLQPMDPLQRGLLRFLLAGELSRRAFLVDEVLRRLLIVGGTGGERARRLASLLGAEFQLLGRFGYLAGDEEGWRLQTADPLVRVLGADGPMDVNLLLQKLAEPPGLPLESPPAAPVASPSRGRRRAR